jgi:mono/diheme cytochrome c family protein
MLAAGSHVSPRVAIFAALLIVSCTVEPESAPPPVATASGMPPDPMEEEKTGAELFAAECARCHGPEAEGSELAPQLRGIVDGYATYVVRFGRDDMPFPDAMPPFSSAVLDDADLVEIFDHARSFPRPIDGAGLYLRFCGNCHGEGADGGRVGQDVRGEADEVLEAVREGRGGTEYGNRQEYMPSWSAAELSDAELAAIGDHLTSLAVE